MIKDIIRNIFLVIVSILFFACCGNPVNSKENGNSHFTFINNWQYRFGKSPIDSNGKLKWLSDSLQSPGWISIKKLDEIPRNKAGKTLWQRTILPDMNIKNPAIFIEDFEQVMQVYIQDSLIYSFGIFNQNDKSIPFGRAAHLIPLPDNFQNKVLTTRIYSSIKNIGFYKFPFIGESFKITKQLFLSNFDEIIIASIYIFIALSILFSLLFVKVKKMFLGLALTLLSIGLWIGSNSQFLQLYFPFPYLYYFLDNISVFSFAIGPFYIAEQIIDNKYKKIVGWLWKVNVLYLIISLIVEFLPGYDFSMIFNYYLIIFFFINIIGFIVMTISASRGNIQTRLIVIGFLICFMFGIIELLIYSEGNGAFAPVLLHFGSFVLVIMLSLTLFYDYKTTRVQKELAQRRALEAINKEKETRSKFTQKLITAQENERKRISFELHDAVGQDLLVIKNMARLVQKNKNNIEAVEDFLNDITEAADNSINDVRDISRALHPYQLSKLGLTAALKSLITKIENTTEFNVKATISTVDKVFEQSEEIHIFRILQECLNNIVKHSNASNVDVSITKNEKELHFSIKDDGIGFEFINNDDINGYGIGITGINERIHILKGTLEINSKLNQGTEVKICLPIDQRDDENKNNENGG